MLILNGAMKEDRVRHTCYSRGVWQRSLDYDFTCKDMADTVKYGYYMVGGWQFGSDMNFTRIENGR